MIKSPPRHCPSPLTSDFVYDKSVVCNIFGILADSSFEMCVGWAVTGWLVSQAAVSCSLWAECPRPGPGSGHTAWPLQCGSVAPACCPACPASVTMDLLSQSEAGIWSELTNQRLGQGRLSTTDWPETRPSLCLREAAAAGHSQGLAGGHTTDRERRG